MRNEIYKGRLMRVFTLMFLFLSFLCSNSFAIAGGGGTTAVEQFKDDNEVYYLAFELPSTASNADYRHQTYGWNINIHFADDDTWYKHGYLDADDDIMQSTGGSSVSLKLEDVLRSVGVPESEFYRNDGSIHIDRRGAIMYKGSPKFFYDFLERGSSPRYTDGSKFFRNDTDYYVGSSYKPLNKDGYGLLDGITHEYGIQWGTNTQNNLPYYYNIKYNFGAIYDWDRVRVIYEDRDGNGDIIYYFILIIT